MAHSNLNIIQEIYMGEPAMLIPESSTDPGFGDSLGRTHGLVSCCGLAGVNPGKL